MKLQTKSKTPPNFPDRWSSSYISYWQPMLEEDQITSGYCWFDYNRNVCRIDGLFNPWSERKTGHRLWMSEIVKANAGLTRKSKIAYSREKYSSYQAVPLKDDVEACHKLLLQQNVLTQNNATYVGSFSILGLETVAWTFTPPGKAPSTYYFQQGTNHLIRMVTGDPNYHASVRDFPNFNTLIIPDSIFE